MLLIILLRQQLYYNIIYTKRSGYLKAFINVHADAKDGKELLLYNLRGISYTIPTRDIIHSSTIRIIFDEDEKRTILQEFGFMLLRLKATAHLQKFSKADIFCLSVNVFLL